MILLFIFVKVRDKFHHTIVLLNIMKCSYASLLKEEEEEHPLRQFFNSILCLEHA